MQKTGIKTRFFAWLLCFLMVVSSVPTAVFAEELTVDPASSATEQSESTEATESDKTEADTPESDEPTSDEGTNGAEDPLPASTTTPAADAVITATVANAGTVVLADASVTVKDINSDGILTYEEALKALHEAYCKGGYEATESSYGAFVTKLWGVANGGSYLFFKNGLPLTESVSSVNSTVAAGDRIYAAVLKDTSGYSDWYTSFDRTAVTVATGETVTLTLTGYLGMVWGTPSPAAVSGVSVGTWSSGKFTALEGKTTDTDGKVSLSFTEPGTYYVTAEGNTTNSNPIMPPVCVVTVKGNAEPEKPVVKHYLSALAAGQNATDLTLSDGVWSYTADVVPSYGMYVKVQATLSEDAPEGSVITAKYTNTSGKEMTATLTSGKASSIWSLITYGMQGTTVTLQVGVEDNYQTYTLNINRPVELTVKSLTDGDGTNLPLYEDQYLVPVGKETVKITVNSNGADLTVNGNAATSGEAVEITPVWAEDNTCTVTLGGTYGDKSGTQTITLKKLLATDTFSGTCGENVTWKFVNGELTLSGSGEMTEFSKKNIPWSAFMGLITSVKMDDAITTLSDYSFSGATALTQVKLSAKLESIGEEAFQTCKALTKISLPDGLKTLDGRAFYMSGLTEISIPASVNSVSYYVFSGCNDLKTATVTNAMGTNMFSNCGALETITFAGTDLTSIPSSAIANCSSMKTLVIPEGVTSIASQSGYNLQSYVRKVTLPNSLTTIATGAFSTELVEINIRDDNPNLVKDGKILYTKDYKEMLLCEQDISGEVTFHDGLESIPASAFEGNTNITKVTLPNTVKTIGKNAFYGCKKLETVVLNEGLESFGENAFYNCYALANIELPKSLTSMGKMAFYACNSLKSIEIPEKITALPNLLFSNAAGLETIILPAGLTRMEQRTFFNCEKNLKTIYFRGTSAAWNAVENRPADGVYEVICNYGRTDIATIATQPEDRFFVMGGDAEKGLSVTVTKPEGVGISFAWYVNDTKSAVGGTLLTEGTSVSEDGLTSYCTPDISEKGTKYYYCIVTSTLETETVESNSRVAVVEVSAKLWEGEGTQEKPFLLETAEDVQKLYTFVAEGNTSAGKYFSVTADITLPDGWTPIGTEENRFAGTINGYIDDTKNATIIVPEGGKPLLGYVINATVKNLNIKGAKIDGYGLIDNFVGISITSETLIENVTILSGTQILQSGLLGTYNTTNIYAGCSATYRATIRNCTVEAGVVIGYNKDQSKIGSLAGRFIGSVENCVSYATVCGVDYVGGLVGNQDNAMGACAISNSKFHGTVEGSGQFVGGILGGGYEDGTLASAPSGLRPNIKGCYVDGTVKGNSSVGGITGGDRLVAQSWNEHSVTGNTFTGTLSGSTYVGGIIGYYRSLNKMDNIAGNTYSGAERGIGYVAYLDTEYENPTAFEDTLVFNTGKGTTQCPTVQWHTWKSSHNRTDDPLGKDADALCKKLAAEEPVKPTVYEIEVSGTYKTDYTVGDALDLSGIKLTAKWTDNTTTDLTLADVEISGYDKDTAGKQTLTIAYGSVKTEITVTVAPKSTKITVNVSILGDSKHGESGTAHGLAMGGLSTWANEKDFEADANETVWDVLQRVFKKHSMTVNADSNNSYGTVYIKSVNGLGEFDNGSLSGWMFTVNGTHPEVGVAATYVKQGDTIILHYTDDYTKEEGGRPAEDDDAAKKVDDLIGNIGTVSNTTASKEKIDAARKAYDALSAADKKKVTKLSALETAEKQYAALKQADDEKAAKNVIDLIDKIGKEITSDSENAINAARTAYDKLSGAQKSLVTNYKTLTAAEAALASILATEADQKKADEVSEQIEKLGTITADSEADVQAARKAYDALSDIQKKLVGNVETLEKAEAKLLELKQAQKILDIYNATGDYIEKLGTPGVGSIGGEWMAIGLRRSGRKVADAYYETVVNYVCENIDENERLHSAKSTENSRIILALTAVGKDVTDVGGHDLLAGLGDLDFVQKQGINGPIWALIALDSGNYPVPEGNVTREALLELILSAQTSDGGWAISGDEADADMTGMALQALAPYYKTHADVKAAVEEAIVTLSAMQNEDGGFGTFSGNGKVATSESTAQVIVALTALGIDPHTDARFVKNGNSAVDALLSYFVDGGGFRHLSDGELDGMATEQGYYALTAYVRFADGKTSLYDMTDVIDRGGDAVQDVTEPDEDVQTTAPEATEMTETPSEGSTFPWWIVIVVLLCGAVIACVVIIVPKTKKRNR